MTFHLYSAQCKITFKPWFLTFLNFQPGQLLSFQPLSAKFIIINNVHFLYFQGENGTRKNNLEISAECFSYGNGSLLLDTKETSNLQRVDVNFSTLVNHLRNFLKFQTFSSGTSLRHVLAETTTGRFSQKKAAETFDKKKEEE